jgi:hypothetical protein
MPPVAHSTLLVLRRENVPQFMSQPKASFGSKARFNCDHTCFRENALRPHNLTLKVALHALKALPDFYTSLYCLAKELVEASNDAFVVMGLQRHAALLQAAAQHIQRRFVAFEDDSNAMLRCFMANSPDLPPI